uniref:Uncharacterized protein n=1 Tax=Ditylenchus dipsaci TaxID=166011 RepID=A0A915ERW3_9BILA
MDSTFCTRFGEFLTPMVKALNYQVGPPRNYFYCYAAYLLTEYIAYFTGKAPNKADLSSEVLRWFFAFGIGFSDRKQCLLINHQPGASQEENFSRTVKWIKENWDSATSSFVCTPVQSKQEMKNVLRMG